MSDQEKAADTERKGNRLSKIVTRTGDAGTTGLGNGNRVSKNSLRIHTLGEVDEVNAAIGVLLCEELPEDVRALLTNVQHDLFDLGGEVCIPGMEMITAKQVQHLEEELDRFNDDLEPLKDFILPGGTRAAALCHQARTICRRAERMIVALGQEEAVNDAPRQYLNRLSDLLFVLGRVLNRAGGRGDVLWQKRKNA